MLVLTRYPGEGLVIGDNIRVRVIAVDRGQVRLGIEAPKDIKVWREEIHEDKQRGDGKDGSAEG